MKEFIKWIGLKLNFIKMGKVKDYLIKKYFIISWIASKINRRKTQLSLLEGERRKLLSIFNIKELSRPLPYCSRFLVGENNLYGNGIVFNRLDENISKNAIIEHGFIYGSLVQKNAKIGWPKTVITFSDYRREFLNAQTNKEIVCIGPYIHYVSSLLSESDIRKLKEELGRILLVFPSHSLSDLNLSFNRKEFLDSIKEYGSKYDTIVICLYWADILKGEDKLYKNISNVRFVTAGHINDQYFLNRLRSIFEISDAVFTNGIGTHVGYSIYFKKPLTILEQTIKIDSSSLGENSQRTVEDVNSLEVVKRHLYQLFKNQEDAISNEQYNYVSNLFGFKYLRK